MNIFKSKTDGKYRYLYKITNIITGQYYYGIHTTFNLEDGYMGSGKKLKKDIKQFGLDIFTKEYIAFFETDEDLLQSEKDVVDIKLLSDPLCYNIMLGGGSVRGLPPIRNILTGEVKSKPMNEDYDKNIWVHITTGRKRIHKFINGVLVNKYIYKEYIQQYIDEGWTLGGTGCVAGKIKVNNGKKVKYISKANLQTYIDNGWCRGGLPIGCKGNIRVINSSRTKEKLIKPHELEQYIKDGWVRGSIHKGRIHICRGNDEHKMVYDYELDSYLSKGWIKGSNDHSILGKIKIVKDDNCIVINPHELEQYVKAGWVRGSKGTTNGKIVIHKDNKNKFIYPSELDAYLSDGWIKGKCKKQP